ncbi:hypothetical protein U3516DRAFT_757222 [Neocallimastix sp. 'constans']
MTHIDDSCLFLTIAFIPTNLDKFTQLHCVPCSIFSLVSVSSIAIININTNIQIFLEEEKLWDIEYS